MNTKQSAFSKQAETRALVYVTTAIADFIDGLYDDDDDASEIPDEVIFTNPYTTAQMTSSLRRLLNFYLSKSVLKSFEIVKVVSEPNLLHVELKIAVNERDHEITISTKF